MTNLLVHAETISLVQTACQETSWYKQYHLNLPVSLECHVGALSQIKTANQMTSLGPSICEIIFVYDLLRNNMNEIIQSALSSKFTQNNDGKKSKNL